jgi:hypothetical protein
LMLFLKLGVERVSQLLHGVLQFLVLHHDVLGVAQVQV